jgi:arsenate reductase
MRTLHSVGMITIYGLKTCDSCRKALKSLPDAVLRDVRAQPLTHLEISEFLTTLGDRIINRASTTWKGLPEDERQQDAASLLARHPALMKRPVIRDANGLRIGV